MNTSAANATYAPSSRPPGPWEQAARRWPTGGSVGGHLPSSSSTSNVTALPRLAPRELPDHCDDHLARELNGMRLGGPLHQNARHRTVSAGGGQHNKPLPPLPPARTPSQMNHQRGMQRLALGHPADPQRRRQQQQHVRLPSAPAMLDERRGVAWMHSSPQRPAASAPRRVSTNFNQRYDATASANPALPSSPVRRPASTSPRKLPLPTPQMETLPEMPMPVAIPQRPAVDASAAAVAAAALSSTSMRGPPRDQHAVVARPLPVPQTVPRPSVAGPSPPANLALHAHHARPQVPTVHPAASEPPPYDLLFGPRESTASPGPAPPPTSTPTQPGQSSDRSRTPSPSPALRLPSTPAKPNQCWGIKRDGQRCTRVVVEGSSRRDQTPSPTKVPRGRRVASEPPRQRVGQGQGEATQPIIISDDDDDDDGVDNPSNSPYPSPLFCHQHAKEVNKSPGFHLPRSQTYISFEEYIPADLSMGTAAKLRTAMAEMLTASDLSTPGHIYVYELRSGGGTTAALPTMRLKVGRSHQPMNRIAQWRAQCSSRQPVLRCLFPRDGGEASAREVIQHRRLIVGADTVTSAGLPGSHKWEKLVHIELSERCVRLTGACGDCGKSHREIFETRPDAAADALGFDGVCDIIAKWERFVRVCAEG